MPFYFEYTYKMDHSSKIYQVGGSVRDQLIGVPHYDIDYVMETDYKTMKEYLVTNGYTIYTEKPEFLVIKAKDPKTNITVDFTVCRKEGVYSDHRRPDTTTEATLFEDLARRDFTINAIAMNSAGEYIDPHNGIIDIKDRKIRCVGNPEDRLLEDPLRFLRAIRFAVTKGFTIDPLIYLVASTDEFLRRLKMVAIERLTHELTKAFKHDTPKTLELLPPAIIQIIFEPDSAVWLMPTSRKLKTK